MGKEEKKKKKIGRWGWFCVEIMIGGYLGRIMNEDRRIGFSRWITNLIFV